MDSSLRLHQRLICSFVLPLAVLCVVFSAPNAYAESEAYRRQVQFEVARANDFRRFLKYLEELERERMKAVPGQKAAQAKQDAMYEQARRAYAEWRKREEAKKPSEEFIERMLAAEQEKEDKRKEAIRKEYVKVQNEIERAIANTRLDEAEEYGLAR